MKSEISTESKIALGTVQFGLNYGISNKEGQTAESEVTRILNLAAKEGINTIDTAFAYGNSESSLGKNDLTDFSVVSKFPPQPELPLHELLNLSLKNLNLDSVNGYMAHRAEDILESTHLIDQLNLLKSSGKVKKIGCSLYLPETLEKIWEMGFKPDIIQIPYNIFDQRFAPLLSEAQNTNCEIHARSAFLQGLFFSDPDSLPTFFNPLKRQLKEIVHLFPTARDRAANLLRFCLSNPAIDKVVIGVNSAEQLISNLTGLKENLETQLSSMPVDEQLVMPQLWPKKN